MITVNTHEAKTKLSALLAAIEKRGERVLICRNGKPVAEMKSPGVKSLSNPLQRDPALKVMLRYDPLEPLSADEWPADAK